MKKREMQANCLRGPCPCIHCFPSEAVFLSVPCSFTLTFAVKERQAFTETRRPVSIRGPLNEGHFYTLT